MQIVIDIPEVYYEALRETDRIVGGQRSGKTLMSVIYDAVAVGTPLPKGHGRLIDADAITKDLNTFQDAFRIYQQTGDKSSVSIVCIAKTII